MSFKKIQIINADDIGNPETGHIYLGRDNFGLWEKKSDGFWHYISTGSTGTGSSGTSGVDGIFYGTNGTAGSSGTSGTSSFGSSGTSGRDGNTSTSGTSGSSGTSGFGTSGTSGSSGSSGTSGIDGTSGSSGKSGTSGSSGSSGSSGFTGSSGTSGINSGYGGATRLWVFTGSTEPMSGQFYANSIEYFNSKNLDLIDYISINTNDHDGQDLENWIKHWNTGILKIEEWDNMGVFGIYTGTTSTKSTGNTYELTDFNFYSGNGTLTEGNRYLVSFVHSGSYFSISGTTSGTSGTSGTDGLIPIIGNNGQLLYRDNDSVYKYNTNSGLTFTGNTLILSAITLRYSTGLEGTDKILSSDVSGNTNWISLTTGVTDVIDRTFDLIVSASTLSVIPYATKKLIDPGYAYFYSGGTTPTYSGNTLKLDGSLVTGPIDVYSVVNNASISMELNSVLSGWTLGANWSLLTGSTTGFTSTGSPGSLSTTISVISGKRYILYLQAQTTFSCTITFDTITMNVSNSSSYRKGFKHTVTPSPKNVTLSLSNFSAGLNGNLIVSLKSVDNVNPSVISHKNSGVTQFELKGDLTNMFLGINSGTYNTTLSTYNIGIGSNTLYSNFLGYNNIAIGNLSMYNNIDGISNISIGVNNLTNNTTGQYNVSIGQLTMYYNTTGSWNTAIGYGALSNNISGGYNIAIGSDWSGTTDSGYTDGNIGLGASALAGNTTGNYNIAIGAGSLRVANSTGNVTVGYQSMYNTTSGFNVCMGYQSCYANTSGTFAAIGTMSLYSNTTGTQNTALGTYSLYNNSTGYSNIGIGHGVGSLNVTQYNLTTAGSVYYENARVTTDSNMVIIGTGAARNSTTALNNTIIIGNFTYGYESNQAVIGNFMQNKVDLRGDVYINNFNSLSDECITDGVLNDASKWQASSGWTVSGGTAIFSYSGPDTSGATLSQNISDMALSPKGNKWYRLSYSIRTWVYSGFTGTICVDNSFSTNNEFLLGTTNYNNYVTYYIYFKTCASPTGFTLRVTSTFGTIGLDNISLKEMIGGDLYVNNRTFGSKYQLDPTVTGNSTAYYFDTLNNLSNTGATLFSLRNSGNTKIDFKSDGNIEILRGQAILHRQTIGVDTIGDWKEWSDDSGFYIDYCSSVSPTIWTNKQTINI